MTQFAHAIPFTDPVREVLGLMLWNTGPLAHLHRAAGADIRPKAEEEQAFVLHWLLGLALQHGGGWRKAAAEEIDRLRKAAKARAQS